MGPDQVTDLMRQLLREAMLLSAPALLVAAAVSFVLSLLQTLTSIQDQTISTVPRLLATTVVLLVGAPWLLRHLAGYTLELFSNFHRYLGGS
ncbi:MULTISPECIES: flagellar biosynthetic protein FliQ [Acidobacterium]|uniref:Flagellar biosynthetic protein FliQ n=1 Tax=Acidobacterium capsulatum (strain ATCC 51196 / DSM 11244 / BCRC 80197 / JCM 7670 / NBRC 15755 / NCIMB 13165 / 161) TaxID=240015 RepID=C1F994_ACIC5|nr:MULTISPECIES: flagellar biosynthetic protein FliQ [Acidobacterium]ACO32173.1 flagellar biosynthetic protein FliQ [Acidobacterium capsulatum ATCC 51196]HCT61618.1 transporter [Acidobacterium sp.]